MARILNQIKRKLSPAGNAVEFLRKHHPSIFHALEYKRPDLIREAYAQPVNGIAGVDGILDDIVSFGQKALPIYQQQVQFKQQMAKAAQTPPQYQMAPPMPLNPAFDPVTGKYVESRRMGMLVPLAIGAALLFGAFFFFRKR